MIERLGLQCRGKRLHHICRHHAVYFSNGHFGDCFAAVDGPPLSHRTYAGVLSPDLLLLDQYAPPNLVFELLVFGLLLTQLAERLRTQSRVFCADLREANHAQLRAHNYLVDATPKRQTQSLILKIYLHPKITLP